MGKKKDTKAIQPNKKDIANKKEQSKKQEKRKPVSKATIIVVVLAVLSVALCLFFSRERKPSDTLVFTVGTEKVYLDEVNFCILQNLINQGVTVEDLQSGTADNGVDSTNEYKAAILEWMMNYKVEYMVAREQGITLTKEEESVVQSDVTNCLGQIDARLLNHFGIERQVIENVYTQCYMAQKLEEELVKEVQLEKQKYCTMYIMLFPIIEMNEDGSYATGEDGVTPILLSEEEMNKRKEDAENALKELHEGADPEEVAKKYGVDQYSAEESNLAESFEEPFNQYANSLKAGECSSLIEIESCYGIVKMIEDNNEAMAEQIMSYYQADMEKETLQEQRKKWYEEMGVGEAPDMKGRIWDKISLYDYVQETEE